MILPVVLYGYETWFLRAREEHRVFGKRVMRSIFGSNSEQGTGGWRKLHSEEFHNSYS
jgi:hypothetical protein